jgi:hypothetical protein
MASLNNFTGWALAFGGTMAAGRAFALTLDLGAIFLRPTPERDDFKRVFFFLGIIVAKDNNP